MSRALQRDKPAPPSPAAVAAALDTIEAAAGGRQALLGMLVHAPETPEQQYVLGLLADPRSDPMKLSTVCEKGRVSLGQVLALLKDARGAKALLESMERIAKHLPDVAEDVMVRSVPHLVECADCWGTGRVKVPTYGEDGKPTGEHEERACDPCRGSGKVTVLPTLERQKVALEIGGLLKRASGVTVNVSQQAATFNFGADARRDFRSATDELLYRRSGGGGAGADVVDAEPSGGAAEEEAGDVVDAS